MYTSVLLPIALLPLALTAPTRQAQADTCRGVHMIIARGSTEPQDDGNLGMGVQKQVADQIIGAVPGSSAMGINYPATLDNYDSSVAAGVGAMVAEITRYTGACPNAKMALLGYSQGSNVITNLLSQGQLTDSAPKNVVAIVGFADPTHNGNKDYNTGSDTTSSGRIARQDTTKLDTYGPKMQQYCAIGDYWCASTPDGSDGVHESEVQTNGQSAAEYVISRAQ